jgi:SAM-dependent methyltransferase
LMMVEPGVVANQVVDWEKLWSPYDEQTYQSVLQSILPDDIVLDIGAGDFRLAQRMALIAKWVYGIEIQERLFPQEVTANNLKMIHADALILPFPGGITVGILLMRHCRHFRQYADKLKLAGARKLITNARWGMGVEVIDLDQMREPYVAIDLGWYACWCGSSGFKPGSVESFTPEIDRKIHEVVDCPICQSTGV